MNGEVTTGDSLRRLLRELARHIRLEVEALRKSGHLKLSRHSYIIRPNLDLRYSPNIAILNEVKTERREEDVWDWHDVVRFLQEKVDQSDIFRKTIEGSQSPSLTSEELVSNFCYRVAIETIKNDSDSLIDQWIDALIRDIRQDPIEFLARIWLTGIEPKEESIRVSNRLIIRKPTLADFQEQVSEENVHSAHAFRRETWFSCIAEFSVVASFAGEVQREADRLISALRLYRPGSVASGRIEVSAQSFSPTRALQSLISRSHSVRVAYTLAQSDVAELDAFLQVIPPALPSAHSIPSREPDFLSTALDWYGDALLSFKPLQGAVASSVACLEALLLSDDPSSEVSFRLKLRAAALLGQFGWPSLEAFDLLTDAYNVRSIYVHGSARKPKRGKKELAFDELDEMFRDVTNYARLALLALLQINTIAKKNQADVIKLLTDSLIDDSSRKKLSEWCSTVRFTTSTNINAEHIA